MTIDEQIAVMQHFRDGGKVVYRCVGDTTWRVANTPKWDFKTREYKQVPRELEWYEKPENIGKLAMFSDSDTKEGRGVAFKKYVAGDTYCFKASNGISWKQARLILPEELAR